MFLKLIEENKSQSNLITENITVMKKISERLYHLSQLSSLQESEENFESKNMTVKKLNNSTNTSKSYKEYKELSAGRVYNLRIHKGKFDNEKTNEESLDIMSSSKSMKLLSRRSRNSSKAGINECSDSSLEKKSISSITVDLFQAKNSKKSKSTQDANNELRCTIDKVNKYLKKSNSTDSLKLQENFGKKSKSIVVNNNISNSEKKKNPINLSQYLNYNNLEPRVSTFSAISSISNSTNSNSDKDKSSKLFIQIFNF